MALTSRRAAVVSFYQSNNKQTVNHIASYVRTDQGQRGVVTSDWHRYQHVNKVNGRDRLRISRMQQQQRYMLIRRLVGGMLQVLDPYRVPLYVLRQSVT